MNGRGIRTALAVAALVVALLSVTPAVASAAAGFGMLTGAGACAVEPGAAEPEHGTSGCGPGKGLAGATAVAVSPDGAYLYVASGVAADTVANSYGSVAILKRDSTTGTITEMGCISSDGTDGRDGASGACEVGSALLGADGIAITPDGSTVFVSASESGSIVAFSRNAETGALTRIGCVQNRPPIGSACTPSNVFNDAGALAISADGLSLYVAEPREGAISTLSAVASGEPSLAALFAEATPNRYLANPCLAVNGLDGGCALGVATRGMRELQLSPDGKQLYGVAPGSAAVDSFTSEASGALTEATCLKESPPPGLCQESKLLESPADLAISPDGANVYVADDERGGRVIVLKRDATTGALSDVGCVDDLAQEEKGEEEDEEEKGQEEEQEQDPCTSVPGLENVSSVSVNGDGSAVYAIGADSAVVFSRDPATGDLKEVSCAAGEDTRCTSFPELDGTGGAAISPDGRYIYVAAPNSNAVFAFGIGAAVTTSHTSSVAGIARIKVACPRAMRHACTGHLVLARAVARKAKHRRHVVRLAGGTSARYRIAPGHRAYVRVTLSRALQHLLRTDHRLRLLSVVHADPHGGGSGYGRGLQLTLG